MIADEFDEVNEKWSFSGRSSALSVSFFSSFLRKRKSTAITNAATVIRYNGRPESNLELNLG